MDTIRYAKIEGVTFTIPYIDETTLREDPLGAVKYIKHITDQITDDTSDDEKIMMLDAIENMLFWYNKGYEF